jgi:large subunit ribosomal protein L15
MKSSGSAASAFPEAARVTSQFQPATDRTIMQLDGVNKGIHKNRKRLRVGRGPGSGRGRTAGRGNKGQGQLAGWSAAGIFEGGRLPLIRRIPKRGFHNRHGRLVRSINVDVLEASCDAGSEVTPESLRAAGVVKGIWDELKILGHGELSKALKVSAHHFSGRAKEKILAAGGTVIELPGPAPVERNPGKASRKKPVAG